MSSVKTHIEKHIVTDGNYGMVAAGTALFSCPSGNRSGDFFYNMSPGQLIAYYIDAAGVPVVIDQTSNMASLGDYDLNIGVGLSTKGDGLVDQIRCIGGESINLCRIKELSSSSPACGSPVVQDFFFDCTKCNETYSVMVSVDDNMTRSFAPFNKSAAEFVASINTECCSCDDCAPEHNCKEVACKLADSLNNQLDRALARYPDFKAKGLTRPFFATRLHSRSLVYCFDPQSTAGACDRCTHVGAVTQIIVNGQTITLTGTTNPANAQQTLVAQLKNVANQINRAFEDQYGPNAGSAYITKGYGKCCQVQLHVNTCDANFAIGGATPCEDNDPFQTFDVEDNCVDCTSTPQTKTYNCGIRVIAAPVIDDCGCDCYVDQPLAMYGRKLEIRPIGDGWSCDSTRVETIQELALPANFGAWIKWLEYKQSPGGKGRIYRGSNPRSGWLGLPDSTARATNAVSFARCDRDYCSWHFKSEADGAEYGSKTVKRIMSHVHIPTTDTTTRTAWQTFLNNIVTQTNTIPCVNNVAPTCSAA